MTLSNSSIGLRSIAELVPDTYSLVTAQAAPMTTGLAAIDKEIHTIRGKYIVLTGFPGADKSALVTTIAANCIAAGQPVLFASLELGTMPMIKRFVSNFTNMLCPDTDIPIHRFSEVAKSSSDETALLRQGIEQFDMCKQHLYLVDGSKRHESREYRYIESVSAAAKALIEKYSCPPVCIVDYLQLLSTREKSGNATETFDLVSHKASMLAHGTSSSVIVPCSINKDRSVRGSGQVNFDCDVLLDLSIDKTQLDDIDFADLQVRPMTVEIKKNRDGRVGAKAMLSYRPASHRFYDPDYIF